MIRRFKKGLGLGAAVLAVVLLLGTASPAEASLMLILSDGVAADTVVLSDSNNTGTLTYNGGLGNFTVVVSTATSKPLGKNSSYEAQLDLNSITVSSSKGGNLTITAYDTGFQLNSAYNQGAFNVAVGGTVNGGSVTAQGWYDSSNGGNAVTNPQSGMQTPYQLPSGTTGAFSTAFETLGWAFSGTSGGAVGLPASGGKFALIDQVGISLGAGGVASLDIDNTVVVPAPPGMVLALSGLPLLGLGYWRKRRHPKV